MASLATSQAVTAGTFTVNGQAITITTSESLADVFTAISTATGGNVTASYDSASDKIRLHSTSGNVIVGAANDTSNFLAAAKLYNNGSVTVSSSTALGTLQLDNKINDSDLKTALSGQDSSGNGTFTINGVAINYNTNTSTPSARSSLRSTIRAPGSPRAMTRTTTGWS